MVTHDKLRRPNRDRQLISAWVGRAGLAVIDALAADAGVTRSDMLRDLLGEATTVRLNKRGYLTPEDYLNRERRHAMSAKTYNCTCVVSCADDPATMCSLSGEYHVHPEDGTGTFGPCPIHPDAPGDH